MNINKRNVSKFQRKEQEKDFEKNQEKVRKEEWEGNPDMKHMEC